MNEAQTGQLLDELNIPGLSEPDEGLPNLPEEDKSEIGQLLDELNLPGLSEPDKQQQVPSRFQPPDPKRGISVDDVAKDITAEESDTFWKQVLGIGGSNLKSAGEELLAIPTLIRPVTLPSWLDLLGTDKGRPFEVLPGAQDLFHIMAELEIKALGENAELYKSYEAHSIRDTGLTRQESIDRGVLKTIDPTKAWVEQRQKRLSLDKGELYNTPMLDLIWDEITKFYDVTDPEIVKRLASNMPRVFADLATVGSLAGAASSGGGTASLGAGRLSGRYAGLIGRAIRRGMTKAGVPTKHAVQASDMIQRSMTKLGSGLETTGRAGKEFDRIMNKNLLKSEPFKPPGYPRPPRFRDRFKFNHISRNAGLADIADPATTPIIGIVEAYKWNVDRVMFHGNIKKFIPNVSGGIADDTPRTELPEVDVEALRTAVEERGGAAGAVQELVGTDVNHPLNRVKSQYAVLEIDDIVVSHTGRTENPEYPQEFQGRDRTTQESFNLVLDKARKLDPPQLVQKTPSMREGPPIVVSRDGKFYALHNGRIMAADEAYKGNFEGAGNLKQHLTEQAQEYGITDTGRIQQQSKPMLVRVVTSDLSLEQTTELARLTNIPAGEAFHAVEIADQYVDLLTEGQLLDLKIGKNDATLTAALDNDANNRFIRSILLGIEDDTVRNQYFTNNNPNAQGKDFVHNLLIRRAFPGDIGREMAEILIESKDLGLKNIQGALGAIVPRILKVQELIDLGDRRPVLDIRDQIAQAAITYQKIYDEGYTITDYFNKQDRQGDLFEGDTEDLQFDVSVTPESKAMMLFFEENKNKPLRLKQGLRRYFDEVIEMPSQLQPEFGEVTSATKRDVFEKAFGEDTELYDTLDGIVDEVELQNEAESVDAGLQEVSDTLEDTANIDQANQDYSDIIERYESRIEGRRQAAVAQGASQVPRDQEVVLREISEELSMEALNELKRDLAERGATEELLNLLPTRPHADYLRSTEYHDLSEATDARSPFPHVGRGWPDMQTNRPHRAIEEATQAIEKAPNDVYAWNLRGSAHLHLGDLDKAEFDLNRTLDLEPENAFAYSRRAMVKKRRGDEVGANEDFEKAESISERDAYRETEDISEAEAEREISDQLKKEKDPKAKGLVIRGRRYFSGNVEGEGRSYTRAIARAQEALRIDSSYTDAHTLIGNSRYRQGVAALRQSDYELASRRFKQAGEAYEKGLALEPSNKYMLNGIAYYHYRLGNESIRTGDTPTAEYHFAEFDRYSAESESLRANEAGAEAAAETDRQALSGDAITFLEQQKESIQITDNPDGSRIARFQTVDDDGNPVDRNIAYQPGTSDEDIIANVTQSIDSEIRKYNRILHPARIGEGDALHTRIEELQEERDTLKQQLDDAEQAPRERAEDRPPESGDADDTDLNRRIQSLNDSLHQTDGINRSQEIRQQIEVLEQERNRLQERAEEAEEPSTPDEDVPPDVDTTQLESDRQAIRDQLSELEGQLVSLKEQYDGLPTRSQNAQSGQELSQIIQVIEQSIDRLKRQDEEISTQLGDAGDEIPFGTEDELPDEDVEVPRTPDEEPEAPATLEELDDTPVVSMEEAQRLQGILKDYINSQRQIGEVNPLLDRFERALESLTTDIGEAVIQVLPEWANVLKLYDDGPNIAVGTMQANFLNFIKRELDNAIGDPQRYDGIIDHIYRESGTADDIREMLNGLSEEGLVRAQSTFLDKTLEDWVSGDTEALKRLLQMDDDGRLEALLGPEVMEAFDTLDTIVESFLDNKPAITQAEESQMFSKHLEGVRDKARAFSEESQKQYDNIVAIEDEVKHIREEVVELDNGLRLTKKEEIESAEQLLDAEAELARLQAEARIREQAQDNASRDALNEAKRIVEERQQAVANAKIRNAEIQKLIDNTNAKVKSMEKQRAVEESRRQRAEAQRAIHQAEIDRLVNLDIGDELPRLRQEYRQSRRGREGGTPIDNEVGDVLRQKGHNIPALTYAPQMIENFIAEDPKANRKIVKDAIREVQGAKRAGISKMLSGLSNIPLRHAGYRVVGAITSVGAVGGGLHQGGSFGKAVALAGAVLGGALLARRWKVNKIYKHYKPILEGPQWEKRTLKMLQAMMDEAYRKKTLVGLRVGHAVSAEIEGEEDERGKRLSIGPPLKTKKR